MPTSSRPARSPRAGRLRTPTVARLAGSLLIAALVATDSVGAQRATQTSLPRDPWSADLQYLQLSPNAGGRQATPSLGVTLGRTLADGATAGRMDWRAEAGWSRAVRGATTAQGVTLGMSAGLRTSENARFVLRPAIALMAGWAESQDSSALYDWRGVPGTADAGTSGTQYSWSTLRGRTFGAGVIVGGELRLTRAVRLSASLRHWGFTGGAAAPNRRMTLAGIGIVAQPVTMVREARRWWHASRSADAEPAALSETAR